MATALKRIFGGSSNPAQEPTPKAEDVAVAPVSKITTSLEHQQRHKSRKRKTGLIFALGGLFGICAAGFFAERNDLIEFPEFADLTMDSMMDIMPAGFMKDARKLSEGERKATDYDSFSVGLNLLSQGIRSNLPVVMIPGVISTGLESWGTTNQSRPYFRKRLWGSWSMMRALVLDKEGWRKHLMLDKYTGLDPPGVKLRAAQGFDAADFFITGYWIW